MSSHKPTVPPRSFVPSFVEVTGEYAASLSDDTLDVRGDFGVLLPDNAPTGKRYRILASGGFVSVSSALPILGTPYVLQGSSVNFTLSASRQWVPSSDAGLAGLRSSILVWGAGDVDSTTTTRYLPPGYSGDQAPTIAISLLMPAAGILDCLFVRQNTQFGNGNPIVYTLRHNFVATDLSVSMASTDATGFNVTDRVVVGLQAFVDIEVTKEDGIDVSPGGIVATARFTPAF